MDEGNFTPQKSYIFSHSFHCRDIIANVIPKLFGKLTCMQVIPAIDVMTSGHMIKDRSNEHSIHVGLSVRVSLLLCQ